jgi:hypothetical protein
MKIRLARKIRKTVDVYCDILNRALKGEQVTRKERRIPLRYNRFQMYKAFKEDSHV